MITDSHCHVFFDSFDEDRERVLERARAAGVSRMIVVGTDLESSQRAFELCAERPGLFPTAGVHPHDAAGADDAVRAEIRALCERDSCVAVGETGLDFFYDRSPRPAQEANFRWHAALACELGKPLIIHSRDAHEDTLRIVGDYPNLRGVMHCYSLGAEELPAYLAAGLYVSFSGIVSYPRNDANRAAAAATPAERLLVETDCPFLAPQRHRGERNEPGLAAEVLRVVAELRGDDFEALARQTSENATALFGLAE